jgi:hypothetical protein
MRKRRRTLSSSVRPYPLDPIHPGHLPCLFLAPFAGQDLATVSAAELAAVQTMREAAEDAETEQFNSQIKAATGAAGTFFFSFVTEAGIDAEFDWVAATALQNGKIKNKVLKLTGEVQALNIKVNLFPAYTWSCNYLIPSLSRLHRARLRVKTSRLL